jgi:autotransporter-associated beta strand protein
MFNLLSFQRLAAAIGFGLICATAGTPANAASLYGNPSDCSVRSDGLITEVGATALLPGGSGTPVMDRSSVFVVQLPNLGAVANPFTSAAFRFHLASVTGTPPSVDLYGLGRRASTTVLAGDYYGQTATVDTSDATLIQNNLLVSTTPTGFVSTSATALKNYLNAQYASGAGAGLYVFLRLSTDSVPTGAVRYAVTSAEGAVSGAPDTRPQIIYNLPPVSYVRPFIWVRDSEKADILAKISSNAWATSVYNGMVSRVATDVASHQADRDVFLRGLPVLWTLATPKFKTIPAYAESTVRFPAESKFNDAVDCAVLYYLTGDAKYAQCAADILHNAVKTLLPVATSTNTANGGWIFQDDFLKEARVTGGQLPIVYDFLYSWLQTNQVYDVQTAGMVNFNFTNGQSVFRKLYQLARDHGQKESNWSALEATCMINNLLALDSSTERATALQVYLTASTSKQASLDYDYRNYVEPGDIWPESLQYSGAVGQIRSTHMVLLERINPSLALFDEYPNLPLSLPRINYLSYPNGEQISFGDGHRPGSGQPFARYEMIYQHAKARGWTDLATYFGSLINGGVAAGDYNRATLNDYDPLGQHDDPLQLLWQSGSISEPSVTPALPRTDTLPFAGIALQRSLAPTGNATYGLMAFVGGAGHVHSHASGMSMELYGLGQVMGAKSGRADYADAITTNYYRLFAANNTVIVNGASRGEGGWEGVEINKVQTVDMEPQPFAAAVSPNVSFTCSSFADNKGTLAEGTQQRTLAIIRTSATTGFYVDVFRSKSTVTNRVATTLNGNVTNQYHDYIYRNIGETTVDLRTDGVTLPLVSQPTRFQNDIGDANDQPGWRYFTNTVVSYPNNESMRAQFVATVGGTARYMDMHMPAVASREYAKVSSPAIADAPSPYHTRMAPTLVIRQIGEAWDKAFATVYEPHFGSTGGTVQNVTQLLRSGIVVGMKIESMVGGKNLVHYVISNPSAGQTYSDATIGLSFTGRFGVAADNGDGTVTLYLGSGSSLSYRGNSVTTVSGTSSQAEAVFTPGLTPIVTSNTPVNAVSAPPPAGGTWVPTVGGTFDWTNTVNWNPAVVPNGIGVVGYQNTDITGNQTVNVTMPITLGELVVGDSSGSEGTLVQKGTNGSLTFDQPVSGVAYLTRTAGGTGTVTFASDLNLTLNDNLTVRQAGGSAGSAIIIAGVLAGSGKGLTKEGSTLTLALNAANTFSGSTRVGGGILSLGSGQALQNSALDTLTSILGDATNGLRTTATTLTFGGLIGDKDLTTVFSTTSGGYSGVTALTLNPEAAVGYSGDIVDGAVGMSLTKTGLGTQTLSGINTYTGNTTVNGGTLEVGGTGQLGSGVYSRNIALGSSSTLLHSSSAEQTLSGVISGAGAIVKNTSASTLLISGSNTAFTGSITINAGTLALGHANAVGSPSSFTLASGSTLMPILQNLTLSPPITLSGSGSVSIHAPDFGTGGAVSTLTLNGAMSGSASVLYRSLSTIASNSQQTIRLNAASTYTGDTTLHPADNDANLIVKLGINNALPTSTVLSINGAAGGGTGRFARFDLNGFNQTIGGLQNTAANLRSQQVINTPATAVTLTINALSNHTFSGNLNGSGVSLIKTGTGTQALAGVNSFTGTTTINAGKLQGVVGGSATSSTVVLNNTTATFGIAIPNNTLAWTSAALTASAAGTLEFDFGAITPSTSLSPLSLTGLANFAAATPSVKVVVSAGLAPGTYPLMTWGSVSGALPTSVTVSKMTAGTAANLSVTGNTLNLVIRGAATYHWDNNGATAGFGTAAGTWAAPTTGNATQGLSTDASGATLPADVATSDIDAVHFGLTTTGLATGTIAVSGTVQANSLTFASGSGVITLSGGNIMLGGTNSLIQANKGGQIINSGLTLTTNASFVAGINGTPLTLNGAITGSGNVTFTTQTGTNGTSGSSTFMILGAANSYSGNTLITAANLNNNLTIKANVANALPATTVLTLDGGNGSGTGRNVVYDLNGKNQTLSGLTNVTGRIDRGQRIDNTSTTAATLTINDTSNRTFSGSISATNINLTKGGIGNFTLSGTTSYTGTTTVNGGTLTLSTINANNDLSTVTLAVSGAMLQLSYTGTDTVNRLFIGSIQKPQGQYGHSSTGATNGGLGVGSMDRYFASGTGVLNVTSGPVSYAAWTAGTFAGGATIPAHQRGPTDDPDNDGISNLIEYALANLDPTAPNALASTLNGTTLSYTKRPGTYGLSYSIESTTDLGLADPWNEVSGATYINNATTISLTFVPGILAEYFLRLQVQSN